MRLQRDVRLPLAGAGLLGLLLLCGCSRVRVDVSAYRADHADLPPPAAQTHIGVVVATTGHHPLLEAEVADKLAHLLGQRGYTVGPADAADYLLTCHFSVDSGRRLTRTVPRHEPSVEYRTYARRHGRPIRVRETMVPGRTVYVTQRYTVYTKRLRLAFIELDDAPTQPGELAGRTLWRCDAFSPGASSDLRWVVNHLLVAAFDHFGDDTQRRITVWVRDGDERVEDLIALHHQEVAP